MKTYNCIPWELRKNTASKLKLLNVGDIFQLQLSSFTYDCYHGLPPSYFSSYFTPVVNMHHYDISAASCSDLLFAKKEHIYLWY